VGVRLWVEAEAAARLVLVIVEVAAPLAFEQVVAGLAKRGDRQVRQLAVAAIVVDGVAHECEHQIVLRITQGRREMMR